MASFVESLCEAEMPGESSGAVAGADAGMLNFYGSDADPGGWRALRLRRWLELPRGGGPVALFVGISPGIHGAAVSGVPFTDRSTLVVDDAAADDPEAGDSAADAADAVGEADSGGPVTPVAAGRRSATARGAIGARRSRATAVSAGAGFLAPIGRGTCWEPVAGQGPSVWEQAANNFWSAVVPAFRGLPMPVTWNAVPFWTYEMRGGVRRNRSRLLPAELELGVRWLREMLGLFDFAEVVAVGASPALALEELGIVATRVIYPSNRWRDRFRDEVRQIGDGLRRHG